MRRIVTVKPAGHRKNSAKVVAACVWGWGGAGGIRAIYAGENKTRLT